MQLGASGRLHMEINVSTVLLYRSLMWSRLQNKSFWPRRMKNLFCDNFIQRVYGPSLSIWHPGMEMLFVIPLVICLVDVKVLNSKRFGVRYNGCYQDQISHEEEARAAWRALQWSKYVTLVVATPSV